MSRFFRPGAVDDSVLSDGDRSFTRLNTRLEPHFLQPGEVATSENGRMDRGVWQPRAGIESISEPLEVAQEALRVPFLVLDAPRALGEVYNWGTVDGTGAKSTLLLFLTAAATPTSTGFSKIGTDVVQMDQVPLNGGGTYDINGVHFLTSEGDGKWLLTVEGVDFADGGGGPIMATSSGDTLSSIQSSLDDGASQEILGSCVFSDPNTVGTELIVVASNGQAASVDPASGATTSISYPTGGKRMGEVDMLQAFDRVYIFKDGEQAWEWFGPSGRPLVSAAIVSNEILVESYAHGLTAGDSVTLADLGFATTDPNGEHLVATVTGPNNFKLNLTGPDEVFTVGSMVTGFTKVPAGVYTQPQVFKANTTDVVVADGVCTVTVTGNATVGDDDEVTIYASDDDNFQPFLGQSFEVLSANTTTISFYIGVEDIASVTNYLSFGRQVSVGKGYQHMPAPSFGVYHQRRLVTPYSYAQTGDTENPVYPFRQVRDEIVFSDILDPNTYDAIDSQFRVTAGIADFLVALQPFYEDTLVVFNRNSIHAVHGVSGSLSDASTRELTREVGCLARKSLAMHGSEIFFLSDNGVYAIGFLDEYNLRGVDVPLSESIQPTIDRINRRLAPKAVGVYHDNRYRIAVPLDSSPGADDATGNNAVLIYNFLNKGWESIDTVADSRWGVMNFHHVPDAAGVNDLFAVNAVGGVHRLDALDERRDIMALSSGADTTTLDVVSVFQPRQYDFRVQDRKRFMRCQLIVEAGTQQADADISFASEDPDGVEDLGSISEELGEPIQPLMSSSIRVRTAGLRGHGGTVTVTPTSGRPRVKSVALDASIGNRSTTSID